MTSPDAVCIPESDGPTYPPLVMVEWTDTTNIAQWTNLDEIADWAPNGGFIVRNIGCLIHEDDQCIVLAARIALDAEPPQVGLYERIPKAVIAYRWVLSMPDGRL